MYKCQSLSVTDWLWSSHVYWLYELSEQKVHQNLLCSISNRTGHVTTTRQQLLLCILIPHLILSTFYCTWRTSSLTGFNRLWARLRLKALALPANLPSATPVVSVLLFPSWLRKDQFYNLPTMTDRACDWQSLWLTKPITDKACNQ